LAPRSSSFGSCFHFGGAVDCVDLISFAQLTGRNAMPVHLTAPVPRICTRCRRAHRRAEAGIRKAGRKDLTVLLLDEGASVGGVFTQNRFCAAPVQVCREHLQAGQPSAPWSVNTGNANAGTGADGLARARAPARAGRPAEDRPAQVLPFSTGVIMEPLPVDRIEAGLPAAIADAQPARHWARAAEGIMTTDTVPKAFSARAVVGGATVTVTGISKGAGMIRPNMATMLGFWPPTPRIAPALMQQLAASWPTVVQPHHHRRRHLHQRLASCSSPPTRPATRPSRPSWPPRKALSWSCASCWAWTSPTPRPSRTTCSSAPSPSPMATAPPAPGASTATGAATSCWKPKSSRPPAHQRL
jgi:hypothetical protein